MPDSSPFAGPGRDLVNKLAAAASGTAAVPPQLWERSVERESLFQTLAECAPVVVWMTDTSNRCVYISPYWREFTGRQPNEDLGFVWVEALHPDDRERAAQDLIKASACGQPCRGEYRVMRASGEYGWLRDHGLPYFRADGSCAGYIGTCTDISEEKNRERSQRSLLTAQEDERRRIARELHDDIGQQISLLAMVLAETVSEAVNLAPLLATKLEVVRRKVESLAQDLHRISHNLHPSVLAHLGLERSLRHLCDDVSKQTQVSVAFVASDSLPAASEEVALALYRVTQEALSNVARHSRSPTASVALTEQSGAILLTITDAGMGFDVTLLGTADGLGLTSIQERVRLIAGDLVVRSSPSNGTLIEVRVPALRARTSSEALDARRP